MSVELGCGRSDSSLASPSRLVARGGFADSGSRLVMGSWRTVPRGRVLFAPLSASTPKVWDMPFGCSSFPWVVDSVGRGL